MGEARDSKVVYLRLDDIIPNRFQPREIFDEPGLQELSSSIKEHGVIEPIVVREMGGKYELIAGERRTKASALAGLTTIPAIVRNMDDKESAKVSLLENLQRKNLSAIEEARTYKKIIELDNLTQEELARTMGKSQPMVANKLRLLMLPDEIQDALMKNQISERHARSLLTLKNKKDQLKFLERIKNERLTVRELDKELKKYKENADNDASSDGELIKEVNETLEENSNKEESLEENNERSFMNNNRGNFGGMGLNDYQNGISGNMYNNYPNNFNNMPNVNNFGNTPYNYNNFDDKSNETANNNTMNSYFNEMQTNSNMNQNTTSSLGSMFDGYNNTPVDVPANNNNDSSLFVSHIREDNLPKTDNQFLPNFDNFNQSDMNMGMDNFGTPSSMDNSFNNINMGNDFGNTYSNEFNDGNMNSNYNQVNNFNNNMEQVQNPNQIYSNYNNFNSSMSMPSNNNGHFMNDLNSNPNPQPNPFNQNFGQNFNNFENNNVNNNQNNFGAPIPDNGYSNSFYQPNQGAMFNQPLNLVDVPNNNQMENPEPEYPLPNNEPLNNNNYSYSDNNQNLPNEENYNDMMFKDTVPMGVEMDEERPPMENNFSDNSMEENEFREEPVNDGIPEINPDFVSNNIQQETTIDNNNTINNQTSNNDYINLDPVYTIKTPIDAVMELKKTTDAIKQNKIDIETEEIDFDDVYQIVIKIKKTDDII